MGATVSAEAIQALREATRGVVLTPGDDGYDAARSVWNGMIDCRPAVIARCTGAADVIGAVNVARDQQLVGFSTGKWT